MQFSRRCSVMPSAVTSSETADEPATALFRLATEELLPLRNDVKRRVNKQARVKNQNRVAHPSRLIRDRGKHMFANDTAIVCVRTRKAFVASSTCSTGISFHTFHVHALISATVLEARRTRNIGAKNDMMPSVRAR